MAGRKNGKGFDVSFSPHLLNIRMTYRKAFRLQIAEELIGEFSWNRSGIGVHFRFPSLRLDLTCDVHFATNAQLFQSNLRDFSA